MPCWYFGRADLDRTPTLKAGIDIDTESKYRREGAKLIIDTGTALGLRYDVCATGVVYFHRFYVFHSFSDFHRYVTSTCCLFLAAKMDESSLTCDTVIKAVEKLLTPAQFAVFGAEPKQELLITEKIVLEALKFDLIVEHPYSYLLHFIKLLKGDQVSVEQTLKMAWTFINDSLCTTLCLLWEPDLIAISLLYLSCRLLKFSVTDWLEKPVGFTGKWYQFFLKDATLDIIEDVCREVLDLYAGRRSERVDRHSDNQRSYSRLSSVSLSSADRHNCRDQVSSRRRSRSQEDDRHVNRSSPPAVILDSRKRSLPLSPRSKNRRSASPVKNHPKSPAPRHTERATSSHKQQSHHSRSPVSKCRGRSRSPVLQRKGRSRSPMSKRRGCSRSPVSQRKDHSLSPMSRHSGHSRSPVLQRKDYSQSPVSTRKDCSPSPCKDQLLSREAFEALQRLMRRQSGLPSPGPSPRDIAPIPVALPPSPSPQHISLPPAQPYLQLDSVPQHIPLPAPPYVHFPPPYLTAPLPMHGPPPLHEFVQHPPFQGIPQHQFQGFGQQPPLLPGEYLPTPSQWQMLGPPPPSHMARNQPDIFGFFGGQQPPP